MAQFVTTREAETKRYILLQPGQYPARTGYTFQQLCDYTEVSRICEKAAASKYLAVDFETRGNDYSISPSKELDDYNGNYNGSLDVVGIGLAWDSGSCYLHWDTLPDISRHSIADLLSSHAGLIAHNVYFDGGVARTCLNSDIKFHHCTYSLLGHLANEGHPDQYWGLKAAQTELLGWADSNDHDLNEWLVVNGYYKGNRRIDNSAEYLAAEYRAGKLSPEKGEMWRAPADTLGKYCVLDAEACYLLYTQVLLPVLNDFPGLRDVFTDTMHLIQLLIEQKILGIPVDRDGLLARKQVLLDSIVDGETQFRIHPVVVPHISAIEDYLISELMEKEPERLKKDGNVSKNWLKWKDRFMAARSGAVPEYRFNLQSGPQLRELLYGRLGHEVRARSEPTAQFPDGQPSVGVKALKHMGEVGTILSDRGYCVKELSYLEDYLARTENRATIHPSFRTPGTMTGRLSSKEPNIQQIPKSKAVMELFHARPGHVWIDLDFAALEPVVLTEFSQDENLLRIYGNSAPKNDIYLFVAASIPAYRDAVLGTGYNPHSPTPESLARAKSECKSIRSICKTVVLACQYGAGVNKIMQTLEQDDVFLSFEEVQEIHRGYWDTFAGVRDYTRSLEYEWKRNGGYILNGMGRPMCVPEFSKKDILNRFVQSTGHDILVKYIRICSELLTENGILWKPVIADWHDAMSIEVPELAKDWAAQVMVDSIGILNTVLQGSIKLRGEPDMGYNLADIKKPEE